MTAQNSRRELTFQMPRMLSPRDGWDGTAETAAPRPRTTLGRLANRFAKLRARYAVLAELHRTSDRELRDMGITRADVGRLFDPEFAAEHAGRGLLPVRPRRSAGEW